MKKKILYLVLITMFDVIGFCILSPETFAICQNCLTNSTTFGVGQPLFFGMLPVTFLFFCFLFLKEEKTNKIYKIFLPYLLVSILIVIFMPLSCDALDGICITKTTVAIFLGLGFSVFSIVKILKS